MTEAQFIRKSRVSAELTQGELASMFGYKTPQFISNWERGQSEIPAEKVKSFCKFTGADPSVLVAIKVESYEKQLWKKFKARK